MGGCDPVIDHCSVSMLFFVNLLLKPDIRTCHILPKNQDPSGTCFSPHNPAEDQLTATSSNNRMLNGKRAEMTKGGARLNDKDLIQNHKDLIQIVQPRAL